ncbi:ig family protein [Stylonychia lemnae]|uniref:Ig family protein n=1 Tax=Stylonychia lemnae TaxID=5949 RepID=A0A078A2Q8_STYLE|nr:ig family protein [Stylonychia lemnae]|eukprot:CDW75069.1 ig family protein [Stylonychia lemnae]
MTLSQYEQVLYVTGYSTNGICYQGNTDAYRTFIAKYSTNHIVGMNIIQIKEFPNQKIGTQQYYFKRIGIDSNGYLVIFGDAYFDNQIVRHTSNNQDAYSIMGFKGDQFISDSDCYSDISSSFSNAALTINSLNWQQQSYSVELHSSIMTKDVFTAMTFSNVLSTTYIQYGFCNSEFSTPSMSSQRLLKGESIQKYWNTETSNINDGLCKQSQRLAWDTALLLNENSLVSSLNGINFDNANQKFTGTSSVSGTYELLLLSSLINGQYASQTFALTIYEEMPQAIQNISDQTIIVGYFWKYQLNITNLTSYSQPLKLMYNALKGDGNSFDDWLNFFPENQTFLGIPLKVHTQDITVIISNEYREQTILQFKVNVISNGLRQINQQKDFCGYKGTNLTNTVIELEQLFESIDNHSIQMSAQSSKTPSIIRFDESTQTIQFNSQPTSFPYFTSITLKGKTHFDESIQTQFDVTILEFLLQIDNILPKCQQQQTYLYLDNESEGVYSLNFKQCFKPFGITQIKDLQFDLILTNGEKVEENVFQLDQQQCELYINAYARFQGKYYLRILATDFCGTIVYLDLTVIINTKPKAQSPIYPAQQAQNFANFYFQIKDDWFTDNDPFDNELKYSVQFNLGSDQWLSFNPGKISYLYGKPFAEINNQSVTIRATDSYGLWAESVLPIHFILNRPPVVSNFTSLFYTYLAGQQMQIKLNPQFSDENYDSLIYGLRFNNKYDLPEWIKFNPLSATISGVAPKVKQSTNFTFTLYANDKAETFASKDIKILVLRNNPPVINKQLKQIEFYTNKYNLYQFESDLFIDMDDNDTIKYELVQNSQDLSQNFTIQNLIFYSGNRTLIYNPDQQVAQDIVIKLVIKAIDILNQEAQIEFELIIISVEGYGSEINMIIGGSILIITAFGMFIGVIFMNQKLFNKINKEELDLFHKFLQETDQQTLTQIQAKKAHMD